jgi:hypothetical protein
MRESMPGTLGTEAAPAVAARDSESRGDRWLISHLFRAIPPPADDASFLNADTFNEREQIFNQTVRFLLIDRPHFSTSSSLFLTLLSISLTTPHHFTKFA